ncbi:MAG: tetratricopeptide repeat protein [Bacteroidetes bacterium]|nr:tetratricopeptide repeat protein [Bacteroidota bacterium]
MKTSIAGILWLLTFLILSIAPRICAQRIPDDSLHAFIQRGIEQSGQQQYRAAMHTFNRAIAEYPQHPAGYINKAILLQVISLDFETPVSMPEYRTLLDKSVALGERMTQRRETAAEGLYYIGMAQSYIAYYQFRDGKNWISGLSHGLTATGKLENCLELNPRAYDAMTGVGTYKYWKSRNMSFLTWTPLVDDERDAGIKMLRLAETKAQYTAQQATNSLIWIYIEEERWRDAIASARGILKRFPKNRLFLWGLASAAEGAENWRLARAAYARILSSIDEEVTETRYIDTQARAKIALMSFRVGDHTTAMREGRRVLERRTSSLSGLTGDAVDRIERRFEELDGMMDDLR